ncbi:hypothetical protein GGS24DRAFT_514881 [Hypoxylon argillaceum]|nr:hypothetical protein GGS24DRAFT_514881 [Hypoxylon argillaceum]
MDVFTSIPSAGKLEEICLNHQEPSDTTSFSSFPSLPPEVRLMVWEIAISRRQIVSLTDTPSSGIDDDLKYGRMPAFLFVNVECRQLALRMNRYPIHFTFRYCDCYRLAIANLEVASPDHVHEDVQHCMIGPDDIVALRLERGWYRLWQENWEKTVNGRSISSTLNPLKFIGHWGGEFAGIKNWMVPLPLNAFHLDHNRKTKTELHQLSPEECSSIKSWLKTWISNIFRFKNGRGSCPEIFGQIYYLVYGWEQPKKDNLTGYNLESIEGCREYLLQTSYLHMAMLENDTISI